MGRPLASGLHHSRRERERNPKEGDRRLRAAAGKAGWNSKEEEKLKRVGTRDRKRPGDSMAWKTAQTEKGHGGRDQPNRFLQRCWRDSEGQPTSQEALEDAATQLRNTAYLLEPSKGKTTDQTSHWGRQREISAHWCVVAEGLAPKPWAI